MGILNLTPDSFSDGGLFQQTSNCSEIEPSPVLQRIQKIAEEGACIADIGAESTRPGAREISAEEELARLRPFLENLRSTQIALPLSLDTYKAPVARVALEAGVEIINDIWGLQGDPNMASTIADFGAAVVIMHNSRNTRHSQHLITEITDSLKKSVTIALRAGIAEHSIVLDPGIGFGKSPEQSLMVLQHLASFNTLGFPVLLGASRKSVIGHVLNLPVEQRLEGTLATTAHAHAAGISLVRVHDVAANARLLQMLHAIKPAGDQAQSLLSASESSA